jgi:tRNA dimethylallyltransferase
MTKKLIVVCGPTASGKTRLGIELCKVLGGEVVSADSMQVYRGMDIGTAKPTPTEREGIPHHMLDVAEPWEAYSVARYVEEATACVEEIHARGRCPVVVGGTGLYIDALIRGRQFAGIGSGGGHREALEQLLREQGIEPLLEELRRVDPEAAGRLHPRDEKRIIRALEVYRETGVTISHYNRESSRLPPRYEAVFLGLNFANRANLKMRIDRRVDQMLEQGLLEEVQGLLARGIPRGCTAMQAIGYKEIAACLERDAPLEEAAEEVKLRSRQYAKRQLSWFRRDASIHWHLWEETPNFTIALQDSIQFLREKGLE